jgi:anaerobic magnesium-protoporphyrin IX monomethyl ester cyclase
MADVVLYAPNGFRTNSGNLQLPTGLLSLSSVLKKSGFSVKVVNEPTVEKSIKLASKHVDGRTIFFGITCMSGTPIYDALIVASKIKKRNPELPIVWGGVHPTILPEQTASHPLVDIVVRGPGEIAAVSLARALKTKKTLRNIRGITYKQDGEIVSNPDAEFFDINKLPMLDYDALDMEKYISTIKPENMTYDDISTRFMSYHSSRGCCHRCSFCAIRASCKGVWQKFTPERTVKELKILIDRYKVNGIFFMDDNFFVSKERVERICDLLIKEKLNIKWAGNCRADYFCSYSREFMQKLVRSGLVQLVFGAESGSQRMLDYIKKDIKVADIINSAKKAKEFGIKAHYNFMLGFPNETIQDIYKTIDAIHKIYEIFPQSMSSLSIYTPYEGTKLIEDSRKLGLKAPTDLEGWGRYNYLTFNTPWGNSEFKDTIKMVAITSQFLLGFQTKDRFKQLWQKVSFEVLKRDAVFRWKHKLFKFSPEWKLVKAYFDMQMRQTENQWVKELKGV